MEVITDHSALCCPLFHLFVAMTRNLLHASTPLHSVMANQSGSITNACKEGFHVRFLGKSCSARQISQNVCYIERIKSGHGGSGGVRRKSALSEYNAWLRGDGKDVLSASPMAQRFTRRTDLLRVYTNGLQPMVNTSVCIDGVSAESVQFV